MRMKIPRLVSIAAALALSLGASLRADVVINEIHFRPPGIPENPKGEFIELFNTGAASVDLGGWQFTKGVTFTFATGTTIPAGGFLVVASDRTTFLAQHPGVPNVVGNWSGSLSNTGEDIKLVDALAVTRDTVTYYTEGDWAQRVREAVFGGWDWLSLANGGGRTLELRNPAINHDNGQNWQVSAVAGGTPGAANGAASTNIEPIISGVQHSPASPRSTDAVTISCKVLDETPTPGLTVTLFWRNATTTTPGAFNQAAMTGDGTGKFSTTLPAQANLAIVEFYVQASDGTLTRTWPAATSEGQNANCQYQVTNEVFTATDAYYLLVLTGAENAAYNTTAPLDSAGNKIDRQFNTTLVIVNGADTTIRYRSQIRFRGNSSRAYQFKPLRVSISGDDPFDGGTGFNLNPKASYLQFMGMRLLQASGVRAPDSIPVRPRRNGVDYTTSNGTTPDFGRWVREEDINGDFVSNHFPEVKGGGIYKKVRPDRYWRNTGWTVPPTADGNIDGWLKQNNSAANDWSDLTGLFAVAQSVCAPHFPGAAANDVAGSGGASTTGNGPFWNGTAFSAAEITTLETVADLDQWARWFAVMTVLMDYETNISNGQDDDYTFYFAPGAGGQRRAHLVTHDMDTILGLGETQPAFNAVGLYDMTDNAFVFRPLLPLFGSNSVAGNAAFRLKYHTALRELLGTVFDADNTVNPNPPFYQFVDNHLTGWVPAATITSMKNFVRQRRTYLLGLIGSGAITPAPPTSTSVLAGPHGNLFISEVLARNVAALQNGAGFPDFIEIRNEGAATADLGGMSLTDDPLLPAKYVFPAGTSIASGAHLVVFADADAAAPGLHAGFALDQDGDTVRLHDTVANGGALLDSVKFGPQATDLSVSRTGGALDVWALTTPTPNAANGAPVALGNLAAVRINEIATNPDYLFTNDFMELYNPGAQPVALGGVAVTDDFINYPTRHVLPALSFMDAGGFLVLRPKGGSASPGNPTELAFKFGATTAAASVIGANGATIDTTDTFSMPQDFSRGRTPDAGATLAYFGLPTNIPTPGSPNVAPPAGILALLNQLRVTEILYTPNALEFIELRNIGATALDLSGVRFTKGIEYTFAAGTTLAPGAYIVVCADRAAFTAQYGALPTLAPGVFTGTLDNADDTLSLQPPVPWDVNILSFTYSGSWYADTDLGHSLVVAAPAVAFARDWDQRETWTPSSAVNGSPGTGEPPTITSALTANAVLDNVFSYQIVASQSPTGYSATGLPAGLGVNAGNGIISGTPTESGVFNATIGATNAVGTDFKTLVITVAAFGPLTGFEWAPVGPQVAGIPFTATFRARDAGGHTVASYNGPVQISAQGAGSPIPTSPSGTVNIVNGVWSAQLTLLGTSNTVELRAVVGGQPFVRSNTFVVSAPAMNVPPSFTKGADRTVAEDAGPVSIFGWATNISPGFLDAGQTVSFLVSADDTALFAVQPAVASSGVLTFTPAANAHGSAIVTVRARDNGGTANGGNDTSDPQTFTITVISVNDAPSIVAGPDVSVVENAGAQTIAWASGIGAGAADEAAQIFAIQTIATAPALFAVQPGLAADGTLTFTPATDASGTTDVTVTVSDDGGTANGGRDTAQRVFKITIRAINRVPSFTPGGDIGVGINEVFLPKIWATNLSRGRDSESGQTLGFLLANDHPELFVVVPAISFEGRLTFTAGKTPGLATITVRLKDGGGTEDGGVDTSDPVTFKIRITSAKQARGLYRGLAGPAPGAAAEHARLGLWEINATASGAFTGKVTLGRKKWPVIGKLDNAGTAKFTLNAPSPYRLSFRADFSGARPRLVGEILNSSSPFAVVAAESDGYSAANKVPASLRDGANKGAYTAAFAALAAPNGGLDAAHFPRGDGWAIVSVGKTGTVTLTGQFADGAPFSYASGLSAANGFPFYVSLYKKAGAVGGPIAFDTTAETRLATTGLAWYRPAVAGAFYPQGWPGGIALGFDGSARNVVTEPNAFPIGSATLALEGGGISDPGLTQPLSIGSKNRVAPVPPNPQKFALTLKASGEWSGTFKHPATGRKTLLHGVILRHRGEGVGFFPGSSESGRATIAPGP